MDNRVYENILPTWIREERIFLYMMGIPLDEIRWRGRWQAAKTLEIYIQEVASLTIIARLPAHVIDKIRRFAQAAAAILDAILRW